jgi:hypothetical protein
MTTVLKIDHVTIAGPNLAPLEQAFANVGMATEYGGPHSNGVTHMALLGFADGSYIELISSLQPGVKDAAFWGEHIVNAGGPCAWATQVEDIGAETARLAALGVPVTGPNYYQRRRPDGQLIEWELAFVGEQGVGAVLPFLIKDITPREWRARPSARVQSWVNGVARVVLGVENLVAISQLFQHVYGWPSPALQDDPLFGATLAYFAHAPVILAAPLTQNSWLADRLAQFGESPCAYLLGALDLALTGQHFGLSRATNWFGRQVAWFNPALLHGVKLGVVE